MLSAVSHNLQLQQRASVRLLPTARVVVHSVPTAPVMIKLKFDSERPRKSGEGSITVTEEVELEVYPSEGLEILKFQVTMPSLWGGSSCVSWCCTGSIEGFS